MMGFENPSSRSLGKIHLRGELMPEVDRIVHCHFVRPFATFGNSELLVDTLALCTDLGEELVNIEPKAALRNAHRHPLQLHSGSDFERSIARLTARKEWLHHQV